MFLTDEQFVILTGRKRRAGQIAVTRRAAKKLVEEWNATYPVGTDVIVTLDNGKEMRAQTRSEAWLLGGHTAVVMVVGIAGGYDLRRCRAIPSVGTSE